MRGKVTAPIFSQAEMRSSSSGIENAAQQKQNCHRKKKAFFIE